MVRDELLAAVTARLGQITAAQDPTLALKWGARRDAHRLARILRDDGSDLGALHALGWLHWYRHVAARDGQDHDALGDASRALTPCFIAGIEALPAPLLPSLAENAVSTAVGLLEQAVSSGDPTRGLAAVALWQRVVAATPSSHPERAGRLSN
ncbi:MAG: hypothetical protein ACRDTT_27340, partial [Pseudonocardiaceae bacterium]